MAEKNMGNWGYFTPGSGVITLPYLQLLGAHLVLGMIVFSQLFQCLRRLCAFRLKNCLLCILLQQNFRSAVFFFRFHVRGRHRQSAGTSPATGAASRSGLQTDDVYEIQWVSARRGSKRNAADGLVELD